MVQGKALVEARQPIKGAAKFLTTQTRLPHNAVKLVRAVRRELV